MSTERKNLPASIHQRLLDKARQSGRAFNELLQYYAIERLLYRLSISEYSELFTLKGALMFNAWGLTHLRPTRDIDLLGHTQNTVDAILKIFQDLSNLEAELDGLNLTRFTFGANVSKKMQIMKVSASPCQLSSAKLFSPFKLILASQM
jgi:hypothetical protein